MTMNELHTIAPEWMPSDIEGEQVMGWRLMTTNSTTPGMMTPSGYQIVTHGGIYEARLDGILVRATHLNMV